MPVNRNNDEEKAEPTERDSLLLNTSNSQHHHPHGPPPRRPAAPPRRPGAAVASSSAAAKTHPLSRPPPVIDLQRRAASTTTVDAVVKSPRRPGLGHFRNKSSLRQLMTEDLMTGFQSESALFQGSLRQRLVDANAGRTFFLDMSMTRSLSVLPEDITDLMEETVLGQIPHKKPTIEQQVDEKVGQVGVVTPQKPKATSVALQYASLLTAVIAVSSNGTALSLLHGVPPGLKLYWRMTVTGMFLLALAMPRLLSQHGGGWPKDMTAWPKIVSLVCAAACFTGQGLCFVNALQYTSIGNVVIGANSQAILLVIGKLVSGEAVHWLEGGGVVMAFFGCIMCAQDEARERGATVDPNAPESTFFERSVGELLAFCAGIFGVFYLILAKSIRPYMPVSLFVSCVMLMGSIMVIPFCYIAEPNLTWNNDPNLGFFGWSSWERILVIAHIVLVCNLLGTVGFVRAMQFFDNLIIAVATLLEPLIATIIAFILGVGLLPGPLGWLGNLVVVVGTLGVVVPSINKEGESAH